VRLVVDIPEFSDEQDFERVMDMMFDDVMTSFQENPSPPMSGNTSIGRHPDRKIIRWHVEEADTTLTSMPPHMAPRPYGGDVIG